MNRAHWIGLVWLASYLTFVALSFVIARRAWRTSPSGLSFRRFYWLAVRFNLRRNFGQDDLRNPGFQDHPALRAARRYCIMLAKACVAVPAVIMLVFAHFR